MRKETLCIGRLDDRYEARTGGFFLSNAKGRTLLYEKKTYQSVHRIRQGWKKKGKRGACFKSRKVRRQTEHLKNRPVPVKGGSDREELQRIMAISGEEKKKDSVLREGILRGGDMCPCSERKDGSKLED